MKHERLKIICNLICEYLRRNMLSDVYWLLAGGKCELRRDLWRSLLIYIDALRVGVQECKKFLFNCNTHILKAEDLLFDMGPPWIVFKTDVLVSPVFRAFSKELLTWPTSPCKSTEIGCLIIFIEFLEWFLIVCNRYTPEYVHFTFSNTIERLCVKYGVKLQF